MIASNENEDFCTLADLPEFNSFEEWQAGMYKIENGILRVELIGNDKKLLLCFFDHGGMPLYRVTIKDDDYFISHFDYQTMEFLAWQNQKLQ